MADRPPLISHLVVSFRAQMEVERLVHQTLGGMGYAALLPPLPVVPVDGCPDDFILMFDSDRVFREFMHRYHVLRADALITPESAFQLAREHAEKIQP